MVDVHASASDLAGHASQNCRPVQYQYAQTVVHRRRPDSVSPALPRRRACTALSVPLSASTAWRTSRPGFGRDELFRSPLVDVRTAGSYAAFIWLVATCLPMLPKLMGPPVSFTLSPLRASGDATPHQHPIAAGPKPDGSRSLHISRTDTCVRCEATACASCPSWPPRPSHDVLPVALPINARVRGSRSRGRPSVPSALPRSGRCRSLSRRSAGNTDPHPAEDCRTCRAWPRRRPSL